MNDNLFALILQLNANLLIYPKIYLHVICDMSVFNCCLRCFHIIVINYIMNSEEEISWCVLIVVVDWIWGVEWFALLPEWTSKKRGTPPTLLMQHTILTLWDSGWCTCLAWRCHHELQAPLPRPPRTVSARPARRQSKHRHLRRPRLRTVLLATETLLPF